MLSQLWNRVWWHAGRQHVGLVKLTLLEPGISFTPSGPFIFTPSKPAASVWLFSTVSYQQGTHGWCEDAKYLSLLQRCKKLQMLQIYLCYFFQLMLIFGPFWVIFGPFGQFWVIFGPIWSFLGNFWAILGNFMSFLGHFLVLFFCGKILLCAI